jgi:branched-chain amino acid transport system substrate-binding protein
MTPLRPLSAAFACLALASCGTDEGGSSGPAPRAATVRVVSSLPMQGSSLGQTQSILNGIRLALEEAGGRAGDLRVEFEPLDDATAQAGKWDPLQESSNANRAANDPAVVAYIGTYNSGAAKIAMPILNRAGLLMVSPANTWPGLTKPGLGDKGEPDIYRPTGRVNYFRVVPADDIQGAVAAVWARKLGVKKVYILDDQEVYGRGIAGIFEKEARRIGIEVLGREGIDPKAPEYKALMTKIRDAGPDLVYFGGITQNNAGQLVRDMRNVGLPAKFMGPDGINETAFIEAAGKENCEGVAYATFGGLPPEKLAGRGAEFYRRYLDTFKVKPEPYAVYGYEAMRVVLEAIRRAGNPDRAAVLEACRGIRDFDGALGTWSFDANGDTSLTLMSGSVVRNGEWTFVEMLEAK